MAGSGRGKYGLQDFRDSKFPNFSSARLPRCSSFQVNSEHDKTIKVIEDDCEWTSRAHATQFTQPPGTQTTSVVPWMF